MKEGKRKQKVSQIITFPVPFTDEEIRDISISLTNPTKRYEEKIINQAFKFHSEGNIAKAANYYQFCIRQGLIDQRIFCNYGGILNKLGNFKEAKFFMHKAIELDPNNPISHYNLGYTYKGLGKLKKAEVATRKAIALNPHFADAHSSLGNILRDLGNLEEAENAYQKTIALNPNFEGAYNNLGLNFLALGKIEESLLSFKRALKINPNNIITNENISFALRDYIWSIQNKSSKKILDIEDLIKLEKEKLKTKLKKYPIWFIDIPRSSSTSTQFMMWEEFGWPFGKRIKIVNDNLVRERSLLIPNHTPAIVTKNLIGEKMWEAIESFTIVRNPYTWCLSLWQLEIDQNPKLKGKSFIHFLNLLDENLKINLEDRKIRQNTLKQSDYLLDKNKNLIVKTILKFEEREKIKSYLESQSISFNSKVYINKSKKYAHQISDSEKKIIDRIYHKDFEILGY